MGFMLSRDLRDRVVAAVEAGMSCRAAAARFGVSASSAVRWRQLARLHGSPAAKPQGGDTRSARIEAHRTFILALVEGEPDMTLEEIRAALAGQGVAAGLATLHRFFRRHGWTRKKDRARLGAGPPRHPEQTPGLVREPARPRP